MCLSQASPLTVWRHVVLIYSLKSISKKYFFSFLFAYDSCFGDLHVLLTHLKNPVLKLNWDREGNAPLCSPPCPCPLASPPLSPPPASGEEGSRLLRSYAWAHRTHPRHQLLSPLPGGSTKGWLLARKQAMASPCTSQPSAALPPPPTGQQWWWEAAGQDASCGESTCIPAISCSPPPPLGGGAGGCWLESMLDEPACIPAISHPPPGQ